MDDGRMELRNYTHARRMPQVIGKIGGWYPIWGVASVTQYVIGASVFVLLLVSMPVWAHVGPVVNALVLVVFPFGSAWAVRRARIDGRGPIAAIGGLISHFTSANGVLISATPPARLPRMRPVDRRPRPNAVRVGGLLEPIEDLVTRAEEDAEQEFTADQEVDRARERAILGGELS